MAAFHLSIGCTNCGGRAVGTLIGAGKRDGVYCGPCGRRELEWHSTTEPKFDSTSCSQCVKEWAEWADYPSELCPGCEAYREHTGAA